MLLCALRQPDDYARRQPSVQPPADSPKLERGGLYAFRAALQDESELLIASGVNCLANTGIARFMKPVWMMRLCLLAGLLLAGCQTASVDMAAGEGGWRGPQSGPIGPFKERLYAYRSPVEADDGGRLLRIPYDELVDINERDEVPVRKVRGFWTKGLPRGVETTRSFENAGNTLQYRAAGKLDGGSTMTVIYVHGRGGDKEWGFDDERFGGNFNRLKNLLHAAGGAYISTDFTDFGAAGLSDIKALVAKYRRLTTGKLVVACGSMGNSHCWSIAQDRSFATMVDGIVALAAFPDDRFLNSPVARGSPKQIPLIIAHGSADPDYDYRATLAMYRKLRAAHPRYPVRFKLFMTGKHGAPVRMIDWRDTLNWIAAR